MQVSLVRTKRLSLKLRVSRICIRICNKKACGINRRIRGSFFSAFLFYLSYSYKRRKKKNK